MNPIAEEILMHYGMPRRSGRYPWGSGDNPYQHSGDFLSRVDELKSLGMSDTEIAKAMGLTTTQYRTQKSLAKDERRALDVARAKSLREDGLSLNEIAKEMGFANDSSVRSLLNENSEVRMNQAKTTAEIIKKQIDEKGMIDVGAGVERELGISKEKLNEALYMLEMEGYPVYGGRVDQVTNPGKKTTLRVICPPGTEHKEIYDFENINSLKDYVSHDDGESFDPKFVYPKSMDSKRLQIRYSEDGGELKDGVVEIRRGVDDLSLGESHYAQVRILVDKTHYIKGMAVYSDDLPDGVDVMFNTNKKKGTPKMDVLKPIKDDPDNPFGSLIKEGVNDPDNPTTERGGQSYYYDKNGKKQLSLINKRAEEGDWGEWADKLPSQFLSKQSRTLIKKQLNLAAADKQSEFDEICSLTNPTVKKVLLKSFADDCDAAAVHLQAAALPRQKYQVILPLTSIKDNEVYAPNYKNGETVALVRYPHGGTCRHAVDMGFTSVMYDASAKPFEDNVAETRNVVEYAHERGASVEAELGHILTSKAGAAEGNGKSYTREEAYTDPEMAKEFIERTNVDALAIGFGTAHGIYTEKPVLDLNRIALIKSAKDIPYVMHGGSGLSEEEYRTAIHNGIRKINYYTYLSLAGGRGVMQYLEDKKDKYAIYFEDIAKAGITAMKADVKRAMKIFESDGKI